MPDKKLEKLQKLLAVVDEDTASPEDLMKLTEALVAVIARERDKLQGEIAQAKGELSSQLASEIAKLTKTEQSLRTLVETVRTSLATDTARATKQLQDAIKRVERKIPSRTDLSGIEAQLESIQAQLRTVPTEITANPEAVRDALELLPEGEKLAIEAIEDLRAILDELQRRPHGTTGGGVRLFRYLSDVNIEDIVDGQGIAWNGTTNRLEPVTLGTGGAGSTYETPTGAVDGANVTFTVTATPKCIIYFGTTLFEGANGYSRSGLTITMPYAPTVADQFKAVI